MKHMLLLTGLVAATPAHAGGLEALCAGNPAFSEHVMLVIVQEQLQHDHDPALDGDTPEKLAQKAAAQGIEECAADIRAEPSIAAALTGLDAADTQIGWDAYNTACAEHRASRGACITAEIASSRALKRMVRANVPPGAKTLVQTCELVMQTDPVMAEWRRCVDIALAVHAAPDKALVCKTSVSWHSAKAGEDAGRMVAACLQR